MNHLPPVTPELDDELNWLAFRYVAGELTAAETASFEARLLDDLAACEAVASMADVANLARLAVVSEPVRKVENPRSLPTRIRAWIAVGSTVAALGWLCMLLGDNPNPASVESSSSYTQSDSQSAADLIARWSQADDSTEFSGELPEITPVELIDADESDRPDIPAWMIAAVSLDNADAPADDMIDLPANQPTVEMKDN